MVLGVISLLKLGNIYSADAPVNKGSYEIKVGVCGYSTKKALTGVIIKTWLENQGGISYPEVVVSVVSEGNYLVKLQALPGQNLNLAVVKNGYQTQEKKISLSDSTSIEINFELGPSLDWPMLAGNAQRQGFNTAEKILVPAREFPLFIKWKAFQNSIAEEAVRQNPDLYYVTMDPNVFYNDSSSIIAHNRVYVVAGIDVAHPDYGDLNEKSSMLYCLSLDSGKILWEYKIGLNTACEVPRLNTIWATPAIYEDKIFVYTTDGYFVCLDAFSGQVRWRYYIGILDLINCHFSPVVDRQYVYAALNNEVFCFDHIRSDEMNQAYKKWRRKLGDKEFIYASGTIEGENLFIASVGTWQQPGKARIYCVNKSSGRPVWTYEIEDNSKIKSTPMVYEGKVYIGVNRAVKDDISGGEPAEFYLYCLDSHTGTKLWEYKTGSPIYGSVSAAYGNIYFCSERTVHCIDLTSLNQDNLEKSLKWKYDFPQESFDFRKYSHIIATPAVANGYVYVGTSDWYGGGVFFVFDAYTGEVICKKGGMGNMHDSPAVGSGHVIVTSYDSKNGGLWCFTSGLPLDNTAPSCPQVTDEGSSVAMRGQLYVSWKSEDKESDIIEYQYKITQDSPGGEITKDWTSTGQYTYVTAGNLNLSIGKTYYFSVKAKNNAGLWSEVGYSDGITVILPLKVSAIDVSIAIKKDYSRQDKLTVIDAFTISSSIDTGWLLRPNHDATHTSVEKKISKIEEGGFGFYESSGGISKGKTVTIHAYVNNNKSAGTYKGSYILQQLCGIYAVDIAAITYSLEVVDESIPPTGSIKINNGAQYTNSTRVILNLSAQDIGSGMGNGAEMQFSNDNAAWSKPEFYSVTKAWILPQGESSKTVYAKFKDAAGNWSERVSASIILDTTAPVITQTSVVSNRDITFIAKVSDAGSGVQEVVLYWCKKVLEWHRWKLKWTWSELRPVQMVNQGNNVYKATLFGSQAENRNIKYYLSAKDKAGNSKQTQEYTISR